MRSGFSNWTRIFESSSSLNVDWWLWPIENLSSDKYLPPPSVQVSLPVPGARGPFYGGLLISLPGVGAALVQGDSGVTMHAGPFWD
ncbi:hypothetical protein CDAR_475611 [Caerostris darwini]|uniref:Uncharacterized protein n=1 Tax=Caerostris darwini TaxID=1538125 RepID=A0AAV4P847_9ARAC|nr:hypothetical protein CDAR_475611 [Caerostris darwini]